MIPENKTRTSMPFKVVQTLEGKKYKLFTIPSGWESNNILRYPNKCISKYLKDENSTPTLDWDVIKCKVKRTDVLSYENGEKLVSEMLKHSDTEDDVDNYTQRRRSHNKSLNLNPIAQDMMGNVVLTKRNTDIASSSADLPIELNYNLVYTEDIQANSTNTSQVFSNDTTPLVQDSVSFDISKMFENQKQILDNQATILSQIYQNRQQQLDNNSAIIAQIQSLKNVQNSFIQKVSALSVQMEDAVFQITSSYNQDVQTLNSSKGHVENIPIYEKPVDSAQELDELENQLSDPNNRDCLKNRYSILCSGEENETNVTSDNGESENEINEEENTINKKKINDSVEEHTKENKEGDVIKNISKDIAKYNSNVIIGKETSV
ncbi:unnamed protein product [Parnassius apollo]|uniref:(apollo) hypothetical protein n=1 Tax=Parnassius apollo TaxID=110799 RepID=A0A8S3X2L4_PARAO|nr:unnamed protein product [Parnassius apollo]